MNFFRIAPLAVAAAAMSACTTVPTGPVEVTRFHQGAAAAQLGAATIFIETADDADLGALEMAPYKEAVARELARIGYRETSREQASRIAVVDLERFIGQPPPRQSPVSIGVGGSTGSYGSGLGVGIGINLGGKKSSEMIDTLMSVRIRNAATGDALWEGRANFSVGSDSQLVAPDRNAAIMADALFREFPGNSGETVSVKVSPK